MWDGGSYKGVANGEMAIYICREQEKGGKTQKGKKAGSI